MNKPSDKLTSIVLQASISSGLHLVCIIKLHATLSTREIGPFDVWSQTLAYFLSAECMACDPVSEYTICVQFIIVSSRTLLFLYRVKR